MMTSARGWRIGRMVLYLPFVFLLVVFIAPLMLTFAWSFWRPTSSWMEPAFDLSSYTAFFTGPRLSILLDSLRIALGVTIVGLLIAYPIAYLAAKKASWRTQLILLAFAFPFLVNYVIRNVSLVSLLGRNGPVNDILVGLRIVHEPISGLLYSEFAVWLGLLGAYMPLMIFPLWLSISGIDKEIIEASSVHGGSRFHTFVRIILPLSMPGIFAGAILAFVSSFGESAVPAIVGGAGNPLIGNTIINAMDAVNYPLAAAISSCVIVCLILLLSVWLRLFRIETLLGRVLEWGD